MRRWNDASGFELRKDRRDTFSITQPYTSLQQAIHHPDGMMKLEKPLPLCGLIGPPAQHIQSLGPPTFSF